VAVPIDWSELRPALRPDAFHVRNLAQRMRSLGADPWSAAPIAPQWLGRTLANAREAAG
jgi:DNA primase